MHLPTQISRRKIWQRQSSTQRGQQERYWTVEMHCLSEREARLEELPHSSEESYFVVAIGKIGKQVFMGWNDTQKTNPNWKKEFKDGNTSYCRHAEDHILQQMSSFDPKKIRIHVYRVRASDGQITMAKPCCFCQRRMKEYGIDPRKITFTDWEGKERKLKQWDI